MDFQFFGVTDISIVVLFLIALFVGYKTGFLQQFIKIASSVFGLFTAFVFAKPLAAEIGPKWLNALIQPNIYDNVMKSDALSSIDTSQSLTSALSASISDLGFPQFLADIIAAGVDPAAASNTVEQMKDSIATGISATLTEIAVIVISFLFLLFGTTILFWILKIIVKFFRENKFIRVVDGMLGLIFSGVICILIIYVLLLVVGFLMPLDTFSEFNDFMTIDMQLGNSSFRLSKYLYNNNIIGNIIKIFL